MNPLRDWNKFWFQPISALTIGLFRIVLGLVLLSDAVLLAPDLFTWFSDRGTLTLASARLYFSGARLCLFYIPSLQSDTALAVFFVIFVAAIVCFTVGLWTRVASIIVFVGLSSLHNRNPLILNSGDTIMRICAFFMMFAPCDRALSIDRLRRIARGQESGPAPNVVPWAQRVIQVQVAVIYLCTMYLKIQGPSWQNGTALYYMTRLDDFKRFPVPFMFDHLLTINIATYGTLFVECSLGTLIWSRTARPYVLLAGVMLHSGIEWTMNIPLFSAIMITTYITFLDGETIERTLGWMRARIRPAKARVWIDPSAPDCAAMARVLEAVDLFHTLEFVEVGEGAPASVLADGDRCQRQLCLSTPANEDLSGLLAARWVCWRLPLLWTIAPLLYLPGGKVLGRLLYDWRIARRALAGRAA